jgi:hypothetical protein
MAAMRASATRQVELSAALSASLTDEWVREIAALGSGDCAGAKQRFSAKNRLITTDAHRVLARDLPHVVPGAGLSIEL